MATKLYVGNLSFRTTSEELREAFAAVGTVESASVIEDRETGRSRGFAFVEMATPEEAAAAIELIVVAAAAVAVMVVDVAAAAAVVVVTAVVAAVIAITIVTSANPAGKS
jgi:hypothetical protein